MIFGPDRPAGRVGDRDLANVDWVREAAEFIHPRVQVKGGKKQQFPLLLSTSASSRLFFVKYSFKHFGIKVCGGIVEVCDSAVCGGSGSVDDFHPFGTGM